MIYTYCGHSGDGNDAEAAEESVGEDGTEEGKKAGGARHDVGEQSSVNAREIVVFYEIHNEVPQNST